MQKFIKSFIIFQIPILCYLGIIILLLAISGELLKYDKLIADHNNDDILIGLAYSNVKDIKLIITEHRNPKIMALGTSRVMQFRDFFFNNPEFFYNAGGAVSEIKGTKFWRSAR